MPDQEITNTSPTAVQVQAMGSVCSRVLQVCKHRSVRYLLGSLTRAINQTVPAAAAVEVSYVLLIRTQPKNVNHNALFSIQQTAD